MSSLALHSRFALAIVDSFRRQRAERRGGSAADKRKARPVDRAFPRGQSRSVLRHRSDHRRYSVSRRCSHMPHQVSIRANSNAARTGRAWHAPVEFPVGMKTHEGKPCSTGWRRPICRFSVDTREQKYDLVIKRCRGGQPDSIGIGDLVPEARVMPLPEVISEKVPKLRGARFTTDRNQAIVIVGSRNRAEAIIGPN